MQNCMYDCENDVGSCENDMGGLRG